MVATVIVTSDLVKKRRLRHVAKRADESTQVQRIPISTEFLRTSYMNIARKGSYHYSSYSISKSHSQQSHVMQQQPRRDVRICVQEQQKRSYADTRYTRKDQSLDYASNRNARASRGKDDTVHSGKRHRHSVSALCARVSNQILFTLRG